MIQFSRHTGVFVSLLVDMMLLIFNKKKHGTRYERKLLSVSPPILESFSEKYNKRMRKNIFTIEVIGIWMIISLLSKCNMEGFNGVYEIKSIALYSNGVLSTFFNGKRKSWYWKSKPNRKYHEYSFHSQNPVQRIITPFKCCWCYPDNYFMPNLSV